MINRARRTILPSLSLSLASSDSNNNSQEVKLSGVNETINYYRTPVRTSNGKRIDGGPTWSLGKYSRFPIVLNHDGSPWKEANLYLIDLAEINTQPNMLSLGVVAEDLAAYRNFITEEQIDWLVFESRKFTRPTYRYSAELRHLLNSGTIKASVAKRRMGTVIRFYNWMINNGLLITNNPPWVEKSVLINYSDTNGISQSKKIKTTDVSINIPKSKDPWDDCIEDGGNLRPLNSLEQKAVLEALSELGNTEITLIHQLALLTGAREQTILTFRLKHLLQIDPKNLTDDIRIQCGPGTGIDTKFNKQGTLHIPKYLYEKLMVYVQSPRYANRCNKNNISNKEDQYLFLTQHGQPFYESIQDRNKIDSGKKGTKQGQSLRLFIQRRVIPLAQKKLNNNSFKYRFHDLRASFGMNFVDFCYSNIDKTPEFKNKVLNHLSSLMWHSNPSTTMKYLEFRKNLSFVEHADNSWSQYLKKLIFEIGN